MKEELKKIKIHCHLCREDHRKSDENTIQEILKLIGDRIPQPNKIDLFDGEINNAWTRGRNETIEEIRRNFGLEKEEK